MNVIATLPDELEAQLRAELDAIGTARGGAGVSDDYLRFWERVARAQAKAQAAIRGNRLAPPTPERPEATGQLTAAEAAFDDRLLLALLEEVAEGAPDQEPGEQAPALLNAAWEEPDLLRRLATAATIGGDARPLQETASRLDIPSGNLLFLVQILARPFLVEARLRRPGSTEHDTRMLDTASGRCPACGAHPGLAVLRTGDGARRLVCLLCDETWLAPRLMCTSCGTRDQEALATLHVAEDDPRWIEVCDACHRYLKTVDQWRMTEADPLIPRAEDARTLHLDLIAEREGYVRPAL
jgi:FdhE protein